VLPDTLSIVCKSEAARRTGGLQPIAADIGSRQVVGIDEAQMIDPDHLQVRTWILERSMV
jgi:hypothetical protein